VFGSLFTEIAAADVAGNTVHPGVEASGCAQLIE